MKNGNIKQGKFEVEKIELPIKGSLIAPKKENKSLVLSDETYDKILKGKKLTNKTIDTVISNAMDIFNAMAEKELKEKNNES